MRHAVTQALVGKPSTKKLTKAESEALIAWLSDAETGHISEQAITEAAALYRQLQVESGQQEIAFPVEPDEEE